MVRLVLMLDESYVRHVSWALRAGSRVLVERDDEFEIGSPGFSGTGNSSGNTRSLKVNLGYDRLPSKINDEVMSLCEKSPVSKESLVKKFRISRPA